MNAKKSLIIWIVYIVFFVAVILAFAKGAQQDTTGLKLAWMGGAILAACIGIFVSIKLNKARK